MLNEQEFHQLPTKKKQLLRQQLENLLEETRITSLQKVLQHRTDYLTIVMENIYQGHNASAILRSCDCFGISDVHAIENNNTLKFNSNIAMGSDKWINIQRYNSTKNAINTLQKQGYKVFATTLNTNSISLQDIPLNNKIALVMGTEKDGISPEAIQLADGAIKIDMYGFSQSLNVSVSTAIILRDIINRLHKKNINLTLNEQKKQFLYIKYLLASLKYSDIILKKILKK